MSRWMIRAVVGTIGALMSLSAYPASADDVADFYKGKTLTIVVGHEVGTGFDIYARTLARHFGHHVPGNPNIVVQNSEEK